MKCSGDKSLCWDLVVWACRALTVNTGAGSFCAGGAGCSDRPGGSAGQGQRPSVLSSDHADSLQKDAVPPDSLSLWNSSWLSV